MKQRTRSQWKEIVEDRLDDVYTAIIREISPFDILRDLRSFELISKYYDKTCLAVDVWFLFDRRPVYAHRRFAETDIIRDPLTRVLFGIIVQAIYDTKIGRPCDSHSWRLDHPPDGERCSPTTHLCKTHAIKFITETAITWETTLNLSDGTLLSMIENENGSQKSRSQEIFNCIGQ